MFVLNRKVRVSEGMPLIYSGQNSGLERTCSRSAGDIPPSNFKHSWMQPLLRLHLIELSSIK